jgi:hypothetical protein
LLVLAGTLAITLVALVPHQPLWIVGLELLPVATLTWSLPSLLQVRAFRRRNFIMARHLISRAAVHQATTLPMVAASAFFLAGFPWAAYVLVPGVVLAMLAALLNAWVLMVEILR